MILIILQRSCHIKTSVAKGYIGWVFVLNFVHVSPEWGKKSEGHELWYLISGTLGIELVK